MILPNINNGQGGSGKLVIDTSTSLTSTELTDLTASIMNLQVYGTFSSVSILVSGKLTSDAPYVGLFAIDLGDASVKKDGSISKAGIYQLSIISIPNIKIEVVSVSGGNASVFAIY